MFGEHTIKTIMFVANPSCCKKDKQLANTIVIAGADSRPPVAAREEWQGADVCGISSGADLDV